MVVQGEVRMFQVEGRVIKGEGRLIQGGIKMIQGELRVIEREGRHRCQIVPFLIGIPHIKEFLVQLPFFVCRFCLFFFFFFFAQSPIPI